MSDPTVRPGISLWGRGRSNRSQDISQTLTGLWKELRRSQTIDHRRGGHGGNDARSFRKQPPYTNPPSVPVGKTLFPAVFSHKSVSLWSGYAYVSGFQFFPTYRNSASDARNRHWITNLTHSRQSGPNIRTYKGPPRVKRCMVVPRVKRAMGGYK